MNIILITSYFLPEINSSAQIYYDLAVNFSKHGHRVDIVTSYPRDYNRLSNDKSRVPLDEEIYKNVFVHRVIHFSKRDSKIFRGLEHFLVVLYYYNRIVRLVRELPYKLDVGIIYIAPLPLYYLARLIKIFHKIPIILNIEEFHPQELTDVGFLKNNLIIGILKFIERRACTKAEYISVHSPGGVDYLIERGAKKDKIEVTFNSFDLGVIDSASVTDDFKQEYNLEGKYLISYGGLFSPFQGIDHILDVAIRVKHDADLVFFIAGDGMLRSHLEERIKNEKINNVILSPFLQREKYLSLVKSSDISLVLLDARMKSPVLPGKLAGLMGLKRPIIGLVNPDCETANIIKIANCGLIIHPQDINGFENAIYYLKNNPNQCNIFGDNGREYVVNHMTSEIVVNTYEKIFQKLL